MEKREYAQQATNALNELADALGPDALVRMLLSAASNHLKTNSPEYMHLIARLLQSVQPNTDALVEVLLSTASKHLKPDSAEYMHLIARLLHPIKPGSFNREGCDAMMAKWPTPTCELISLRRKQGSEDGLEILLSKRPPDVAHGGQWHFAGGVWYTGENANEKPVVRIGDREHGDHRQFRYVGPISFMAAADDRGTVVCCYNLIEWLVEPSPTYGQWFDVDHLPEPMIPHHREIIKIAAKWYREHM